MINILLKAKKYYHTQLPWCIISCFSMESILISLKILIYTMHIPVGKTYFISPPLTHFIPVRDRRSKTLIFPSRRIHSSSCVIWHFVSLQSVYWLLTNGISATLSSSMAIYFNFLTFSAGRSGINVMQIRFYFRTRKISYLYVTYLPSDISFWRKYLLPVSINWINLKYNF